MICFGAGQARAVDRYVVIIANNHSLDDSVPSLRYADDDGVRYLELFRLLTDKVALFTVLDDETARLHPGVAKYVRPPASSAIMATLQRYNDEMLAAKRAGRETELYLVYAGHGDRESSGEGYVNLLDAKLRRRDLYHQILGPAKADFVHLIIDACQSYFLVNRRGRSSGEHRDDAALDDFLRSEDLSAYPHVGVILATSGDASTHEWSRFRAGILSHELRSGLAGAADVNADGRIEYSELHAFIAAANARVRHPEAKLTIFARPPRTDRRRAIYDLRWARGARLLRFGPRLAGRYRLEDARGVRAVDLNKALGTQMDLVVDRQRAYFLRHGDREAAVAPGKERIVVAALRFDARASTARGASLDRSFRRDLFRLPFSRGFYDGFAAQAGHLPVSLAATVDDGIEKSAASSVRQALSLGYSLSDAVLDAGGLDHGVQLRYDFDWTRSFALSATFEYGRITAGVNRVALLGGVAWRARLFGRLVSRADLLLGYQAHTGASALAVRGRVISGDDPAGLRSELSLALRHPLVGRSFVDLRGGVAFDMVTIDASSFFDAKGFGVLSIGQRF